MTSSTNPTTRAALAELVALKDLKERFQFNGEWSSNRNRDEYCHRQPLAWAAAREALASLTPPAEEAGQAVAEWQARAGGGEWKRIQPLKGETIEQRLVELRQYPRYEFRALYTAPLAAPTPARDFAIERFPEVYGVAAPSAEPTIAEVRAGMGKAIDILCDAIAERDAAVAAAPSAARVDDIPLSGKHSLHRPAGRFQSWRLLVDGEEIRRLNKYECEFIEAALSARASTAPVARKLRVEADDIGRDPDGEVSLDYATESGDMLTISVNNEGRLAYAVTVGSEVEHNTVTLGPLFYRVLSAIADERDEVPAPDLLAKQAEALKDAERYRWLRANRTEQQSDGTEVDPFDEDGCLLWYEYLDRAIDAALGQAQEKAE